MSTLTLTECDLPPAPWNSWLCPWVCVLLKGTVKLTDPWLLSETAVCMTWDSLRLGGIGSFIPSTVFCVRYWLATFLQSWGEFSFAGRQIAVSKKKNVWNFIIHWLELAIEFMMYQLDFFFQFLLNWISPTVQIYLSICPFLTYCWRIDWWIEECCYVGSMQSL